MAKVLARSITTQIRAHRMARFLFCPKMVSVASYICLKMSTMDKEWEVAVTEAMVHIKAIHRISHLYQVQRSANLHCLHHSWPNLKDLILNWHCTLRIRWRWQKLTIKHTSFQKWAVWHRKRCKMMIIRLCSTI